MVLADAHETGQAPPIAVPEDWCATPSPPREDFPGVTGKDHLWMPIVTMTTFKSAVIITIKDGKFKYVAEPSILD